MENIIEIKDLNFKYDDKWILEDINLKIPKGVFVSVIGPNGCGKTTLLKVISRMANPQKGNVLIKGRDIKNYSHKELAREIAIVHQNSNPNFGLTCEEVVLMGRYPYQTTFKWEDKNDKLIARECMEYSGVWNLRNKYMTELSGGEFQRLMIAKALAQDTGVVLMDEPVASLDLKYQVEILSLCKRLIREKGITIIAPLHDINLARQFSDKTVIIQNGSVVEYGDTNETISHINIENLYDIKVRKIYDCDENIYYFPAI
ncbi:MAG: ABC transporter ATP-binding protein [Eubacteriales bacterium]